MDNSRRIQCIKQKLQAALEPTFIEVLDDSARHSGHIGARSGKGHFILNIAAAKLGQCSKVDAHRIIYAALGDLMQTDIHAINININHTDPKEHR